MYAANLMKSEQRPPDPGLAIESTWRYRPGLILKRVIGVFLSIVITTGARAMDPSAAVQSIFEQHQVDTGAAQHQTVLTGFLLGGPIAELAVVHIDETGSRRLRIYAFGDDAWAPGLDATLRPEVSFVDVANIGGYDRLVTYGGGSLNWFDPESATERELVAVTSNFNLPHSGQIAHVDITRDLNADGRDDLIVPNVDGFRVFIQMEDGVFADPVTIGSSSGMGELYRADGYRYEPWVSGRVHEADYNQDGCSDLVFWNEDHFMVHLQDGQGLFAPVPETFTADVAFDSDDPDSLAAPGEVRRRAKDQALSGNLTGRVLHSLSDVNGDGVADLVIFSLQGGSPWKMHSAFEVHFGTPTDDGATVFAPVAGAVVHSDGIPFGTGAHDFDHDGQVDMMFTTINPRIFKAVGMIVSALLTHSVSIDLTFYHMDGGIYPDQPDATRKIKAHTLNVSGERAALFPPVLIGDVDGDGRSDLLVGSNHDELRVYSGVPGPGLFARRPQKVAVAMPNEEYAWLVDLNKDGSQDVLIHHPSTTGPHQVTTLIAR